MCAADSAAPVAVAMSGGVDSSVAAALLLEQGGSVVGVTMLLDEHADVVTPAREVAAFLGIEHHVVDLRSEFESLVRRPFAEAYSHGRTPNPCTGCNRTVKFGALWDIVRDMGVRALATGHYARIQHDAEGAPWLARGIDREKDQSYFLYRLDASVLARTVFPLGALTKALVRAKAHTLGLPVASREESQEVCFIEPGAHAEFVGLRHPEALTPGDIRDRSGSLLGRHRGLAHYTVGQRKGLGIAAAEPLYVVELRAETNEVVVGPAHELERTRVEADDVVWRGSEGPVRVDAAIRYRARPQAASARVAGERLIVEFDEPVSGVAPGQAIVCYAGERVLGGGEIACAD